jgi:hypothetical protein
MATAPGRICSNSNVSQGLERLGDPGGRGAGTSGCTTAVGLIRTLIRPGPDFAGVGAWTRGNARRLCCSCVGTGSRQAVVPVSVPLLPSREQASNEQ